MSFAFLGRLKAGFASILNLRASCPPTNRGGWVTRSSSSRERSPGRGGIEEIAWAFDPLQAGNAHFNLSRLGARGVRYVENMYGERTDRLNAGVPTDRLIVLWDVIGPPPVPVSFAAANELPRLIDVGESGPAWIPTGSTTSAGLMSGESRWKSRPISSPFGPATQEWPSGGLTAGTAGRFGAPFDQSYSAVHFVRDDSSGSRRGLYVLERMGSAH